EKWSISDPEDPFVPVAAPPEAEAPPLLPAGAPPVAEGVSPVPEGGPPPPMAAPPDPGVVTPGPEEVPSGVGGVCVSRGEGSPSEGKTSVFAEGVEGFKRPERRSGVVDGRNAGAFFSGPEVCGPVKDGRMRRSTSAYSGAGREKGLGLNGNIETYSHKSIV